MLLSIRRKNNQPQGNAVLGPNDVEVKAIGKSAVLYVDPNQWSGRALDVKFHIEMNYEELAAFSYEIHVAMNALRMANGLDLE